MDFISLDETPDFVRDLPAPFHDVFLGVHVWQWIGLALLVVVARIAMAIGNRLAVRLMSARDRYLPGELSAETHGATRRAAGLMFGVLICFPLTGPLSLPPKFERGVLITLQAMLIAAFAMLGYAVWDMICDSMASRAKGIDNARAEKLLVPLTRRLVRAVIFVIAMMVALTSLFHINVAAVATSLGIGGIVVALAAKDSVENLFGSVTLLFDMPFAIGDWVRIDKIEGIIEEINLRSTRVRTFEDTMINLPNSNLIRASVENVSARRTRREKINLRIPYDTAPEKVTALCEDLRSFLGGMEKVDHDRIIVRLSDMDDTAMTVLIQCYFAVQSQADELATKETLLTEVMRLRIKHAVPFSPASVNRMPAG